MSSSGIMFELTLKFVPDQIVRLLANHVLIHRWQVQDPKGVSPGDWLYHTVHFGGDRNGAKIEGPVMRLGRG